MKTDRRKFIAGSAAVATVAAAGPAAALAAPADLAPAGKVWAVTTKVGWERFAWVFPNTIDKSRKAAKDALLAGSERTWAQLQELGCEMKLVDAADLRTKLHGFYADAVKAREDYPDCTVARCIQMDEFS